MTPAAQSPGDMGTCRTGAEEREPHPTGGSKVLQGSGSETWNLTKAVLARLEGFHVRDAYRMAQVHRPKRVAGNRWEYPKTSDVLEECDMATIQHYIQKHRATTAIYIADWLILEAC